VCVCVCVCVCMCVCMCVFVHAVSVNMCVHAVCVCVECAYSVYVCSVCMCVHAYRVCLHVCMCEVDWACDNRSFTNLWLNIQEHNIETFDATKVWKTFARPVCMYIQ